MKIKMGMRRAGIFVFFDKEGVVDRYAEYLIAELKKNVDYLVIVVNGLLLPDERKKLNSYAEILFVRENVGLDAAAFKEGFVNLLGWEKLNDFDEVLLVNDTFYGPFYPFSEIFAEMNEKDIDFWGLTEHYSAPGLKSMMPAHLQTYFIAVRKSMYQTREFQTYWENMPVFNSFYEVVLNHEVQFTQHFASKGFTYEAFVDLHDLDEPKGLNVNYYAFAPDTLVRDRRFCTIKRKNFDFAHSELLVHSGGEELGLALEYVQHHTSYDVSMIWENLLRLYDVSKLKQSLHLNYIIPNNLRQSDIIQKKICIIISARHEELFTEVAEWANSVLFAARVVVLTDTEDKQKILEKVCKNTEILLMQDEKWWEVASDEEYVCYIEDVVATGLFVSKVSGKSYRYLLRENLLKDQQHINGMLYIFEQNSNLGILAPPLPVHANYYGMQKTLYWNEYYNQSCELANELELSHIPSRQNSPLMINYCGWYRGEVIRYLKNNLHTNVRQEYLARILPQVAQELGYYTGTIMTDAFASLHCSNLQYMLEHISALFNQRFYGDRFAELMAYGETSDGLPIIGVKGALKIWLKKHLPPQLIKILKKVKIIFRRSDTR